MHIYIGIVGPDDLKIACQLDMPLLAPEPQVAAVYSSKVDFLFFTQTSAQKFSILKVQRYSDYTRETRAGPADFWEFRIIVRE